MSANNRLWGAEPIRGELLKLDIRVSKRTIQKYMRQVRPKRAPGQNWKTFLLYWLLGSSVQKQARPDGERSSFPACKHRRVGVESDVVDSILMLEQPYFHMMEKLLVWLVFLPLSSG
jgi:hypothetical protein